jgi:hypothetical protein
MTWKPGKRKMASPLEIHIGLRCDIESCVNGPVPHPRDATCQSGFDELTASDLQRQIS